MYFHKDAGLVYLAHPRTASSSTSTALKEIGFEGLPPIKPKISARNLRHHAGLYAAGSPVTPETRKDWFVFAAVRNTFDAAVSWSYIGWPPPNPPWGVKQWRENLNAEYIFGDRMWFHDADLDVVMRYESLLEDLEIVLTSHGLPVPELPHMNKSEGRMHYREYFLPEGREYVENRFRLEIEKYGYEF